MSISALESVSSTTTTAALPKLQSQIRDGDVAMMIMATTFVMLQTPAMGIAQAGMIRRKNALSMLMQTLTGMAIGSVLWYIVGFSFVFGESAGGFIGNPFGTPGFFLKGVSHVEPNPNAAGAADTIPGTLLAAFQMMFALMVPVIVTGAWAERMTFGAFLIFVVLWPLFVYYPLAHWVWNNSGFLAKWGVIDFAGGITIHTATGLAALAVTKVLEARKNHQHIVHQHHNLPLSTLGAALIWGGWYSFNGGSAYKANFQAASALLNTHISACAGGLTWVMLARFEGGKWPLSSIINGAFAGLAGITAGSGFVPSQGAFCIGMLCSIAGYFTVKLRLKLGLDDVCEVIGLQGAPGFLGSILVGFAAKADHAPCSPSANPDCCSIDGAGCGTDGIFFGGNAAILGKQVAGASLGAAWAFGWTYVIMQIIARTVGCEVSPDQEEKGLDETQIGELGYDHDLAGTGDIHHSHDKTAVAHDAEKLCDVAARGDLIGLHKLFLFSEVDATSVDYDLRSPAHIAAAHGHLSFLKELYRFGCPLDGTDRWGNTPLKEAISNGQDQVIAWLVEEGISESEDSLADQLCEAAAEGNTTDLRRLLAAGVDVDAMDYDRRRGLHLAAAEGHLPVIDLLLRAGADPTVQDRWGHYPLDDAQISGFDDCYEMLEKVTPKAEEYSLRRTREDEAGASTRNVFDPDQPSPSSSGVQERQNNNNNVSSNFNSDNDDDDRHHGVTFETFGQTEEAAYADAKTLKALGNSLGKSLGNNNNNTDTFGNADDNMDDLLHVRQQRAKPRKAQIADRLKHIEDLAQDEKMTKEANRRESVAAGAGSKSVVSMSPSNLNSGGGGGGSSRVTKSIAGDQKSVMGTNIAKSAIGGASIVETSVQMDSLGRQIATDADAGARELCAACSNGNLREVKRLLKKKADPAAGDYDGRCALHLAAINPDPEIIKAIFDFYPDINCNVLDRFHQTPLEEAVHHKNEAVADLLRQYGAVIVNSKKGSALCKAASKGDLNSLIAFKAIGTDLSLGDYDSRTSLHLAASEGQYECLEWLLSPEGGNLGKICSPCDRWGMAPISDAMREGHRKCFDLLRKYVIAANASSSHSRGSGNTSLRSSRKGSLIASPNNNNANLGSGDKHTDLSNNFSMTKNPQNYSFYQGGAHGKPHNPGKMAAAAAMASAADASSHDDIIARDHSSKNLNRESEKTFNNNNNNDAEELNKPLLQKEEVDNYGSNGNSKGVSSLSNKTSSKKKKKTSKFIGVDDDDQHEA